MATFFQTWNIPGSKNFKYICFDAKSRIKAEVISNGLQGSLVSYTESKKWKFQSGTPILNECNGRENFEIFEKNSVNSLRK